MPYVLYATMKNGDGHVQEVGRFEDLEEIRIRIGMFAPDVVIEITHEKEEGEDEDEDIDLDLKPLT